MTHTRLYKGIPVSSELYPLMRYMESSEEYREELGILSKSWDNLALLAQLGNTQTHMNETKEKFSQLTVTLLNHLAQETLEKTVNEMSAKAQIAVDIVIRNLYERTADIGFLATDDDIREFLKHVISMYDPNYKTQINALKNRFKEYIAKYSVYYDIVLMTKKGQVLLSLNDANPVTNSKDTLIDLVLSTQDDYVESYKYHDFLPHLENSLVYAYKVTETNDKNSPILGVLLLCFRFHDEMKGIFSNLVSLQNKECITLLDHTGKVIASSDKYHIPIGATVEMNLSKPYKIVSFGGREYLAKTCKTNGYQGFKGLGWLGHIMVPIEHAFHQENEQSLSIGQDVILAILQNGDFPEELKSIPLQANRIQEELNRALWNGSIAQNKIGENNKNFSRLLLEEIGKVGAQTKDVFSSSIMNLTQTMILNNSTAISSLMIDIMDRNLYERANDCRWWALTSEFRRILEKESLTDDDKEKMSSILSYINALYTVYTNLFIYDKNGIIIAVSQEKEKHLIGKKLSTSWVQKTLTIKNSSHYCVSDFEVSDLYDNRYTYIYNASIRSLHDDSLGGIGIVFNSQKEFQEMLWDALPQSHGDTKHSTFGFYTTKDKMIIASSHNESLIGNYLTLDDKFFNLSQGESYNEIIIYEGNYYAVGATCSKGYREYKSTTDTYHNDVIAFFFSYISKADLKLLKSVQPFKVNTLMEETQDKQEIATFLIGERWLGVHGGDVIEAVSIEALQDAISMTNAFHFKGTLIYKNRVVSVLDLKDFIKEEEPEYTDIVILKYGTGTLERYIGILVNALCDISEVSHSKITPIDKFFINNGALMEGIVVPEERSTYSQALTILNIEKVGKELIINTSQEIG